MTSDFLKNGEMRTHSMHDPSVMTCLANDFGYENVFSKQLEIVARQNDLLVANSSSGESPNIFANNEVATIDNINYTAKAASTIQIDEVDNVTATGGKFEATGNFSTARTINGKALTVTGDTSVKVAFDTTNGITEISNLDAGATVSYPDDATIKPTGDGTYTFDNQTFVIAGDSEPGVTFTMADATVTKIEGLDRSDSGSYVTVDITDNGTNLSRIIKTPGANSIERGNNEWSVPELDIESYIVTYDGNFKVQAVTNNSVITLTSTDYTVDGTTLTITGNDENKKPVVVTNNSTTDSITVDLTSGISNTGSMLFRLMKTATYTLAHKKIMALSLNQKMSARSA